jgi:hypothetical protein
VDSRPDANDEPEDGWRDAYAARAALRRKLFRVGPTERVRDFHEYVAERDAQYRLGVVDGVDIRADVPRLVELCESRSGLEPVWSPTPPRAHRARRLQTTHVFAAIAADRPYKRWMVESVRGASDGASAAALGATAMLLLNRSSCALSVLVSVASAGVVAGPLVRRAGWRDPGAVTAEAGWCTGVVLSAIGLVARRRW